MAINPNLEDASYVGLSPLSLEDIQNFFDSYVKPYAPYREEKVYNTLMNTISSYYHGQLYTVVPDGLKQIFEEANIQTTSVYNQLLIAIGVPDTIVNVLSFTDKLIFLRTFADFERYKGTISFFQKVGETFNDRISIYELYIDINSNNLWVFKPVTIYLNDSMEEKLVDIPYSTIYNIIPSLLLTEEQLTTMYLDEQLVLPIKSNLIMLDNDLTTDVSILYDVIVAIFLHTYQNNYVDLYFSDKVITAQIKTIYYLWYYLLSRYYNYSWPSSIITQMLEFVYGNIAFPSAIGTTPTTIDQLETIITRYNDIRITSTATRDIDNCRQLRDEFYQDIADAFYTMSPKSAVSIVDMRNELIILNPSLISYIEDRLTLPAAGESAEISLILTEIYASLQLYCSTYSGDNYLQLYSDYFLRYLPQIIINPEDTTSHTILYNLKPYHVELYSIATLGVRSEDKFNQIYYDDESNLNFLYSVVFASALEYSLDYLFGNEFIYSHETAYSIKNYLYPSFIFVGQDDHSDELYDIFEKTMMTLSFLSNQIPSDQSLYEFLKDDESSLAIESIFNSDTSINSQDDQSDEFYEGIEPLFDSWFDTEYDLTDEIFDELLTTFIDSNFSLIISGINSIDIDTIVDDDISSDVDDYNSINDYFGSYVSSENMSSEKVVEHDRDFSSNQMSIDDYIVGTIDPIITITCGANGTIAPDGIEFYIPTGTDITFTITADGGYSIDDVLVDGISVGSVGSYDFINVTSDHTLEAIFV